MAASQHTSNIPLQTLQGETIHDNTSPPPLDVLTKKIVRSTVRDPPSKMSRLDSKPFVIGIPFGVWVRLLLNSPSLGHK